MRLNQRNLDLFKKVHQEMNNPERVYDYLNSGWSLVDIRLEDGEDQGEGTQRTIYTLGWNKSYDGIQKAKSPYEELHAKANYVSKKYLEG